MSATIGHVEAFDKNAAQWKTCPERFKHFVEANGIESGRKVPVLFSLMGCKAYGLLHSLVAPEKPGDKRLNKSPEKVRAVVEAPAPSNLTKLSGEEKPIAFASRTLSKVEQNYAQIEREALAIIFVVRKIHQYLYG
ncbi:hypothetical protein MHYP_G00332690 [Metynnis hypsauchen]